MQAGGRRAARDPGQGGVRSLEQLGARQGCRHVPALDRYYVIWSDARNWAENSYDLYISNIT